MFTLIFGFQCFGLVWLQWKTTICMLCASFLRKSKDKEFNCFSSTIESLYLAYVQGETTAVVLSFSDPFQLGRRIRKRKGDP